MRAAARLSAFVESPLQTALLVTTCLICATCILVGGAQGALLFGLGCGALGLVGIGIAEPLGILVLAIIVSCTAGALGAVGSIEVGSTKITLSGLMTAVVVTGTVISLLSHLPMVRASRVRALLPFWIFSVWAIIRSFGPASLVEGLRDATLFLVPPLVGLLTSVVLDSRPGVGGRLATLIMGSCAIPIVVLVASLATGNLEFEPLGFTGPIGTRPLALFLLVVTCAALARWRHGHNRLRRFEAMMVVAAAITVILVSLSRMAIAVAVGLLLPLRFIDTTTRRLPQVLLSCILGLTLFLVVLQVPAMRVRFIGDSRLSLVDWKESGYEINTYGRDSAWSVTWNDALIHPVLGSGTGTARALMEVWVSALEHPHNDYLRVFHDQGLVGLIIMLWAWAGRALYHWRQWAQAKLFRQGHSAERHMAATLASIALMAAFTTENPLVYVFVQIPVFVLFSIADGSEAAKYESVRGVSVE